MRRGKRRRDGKQAGEREREQRLRAYEEEQSQILIAAVPPKRTNYLAPFFLRLSSIARPRVPSSCPRVSVSAMQRLLPAHQTKHLPTLAYPFSSSTFLLAQASDGLGNGTTLWLAAQVLSAYVLSHHKPCDTTPRPRPRVLELGSGIGLTACVCVRVIFVIIYQTDLCVPGMLRCQPCLILARL